MSSGTKDRGMAALLKAYAVSIGKNVRTAQRHRETNHPDWLRFMGSQAVQVIRPDTPRTVPAVAALSQMSPMTPDGETPPDIEDEDDAHLSEAQIMEKHHWKLWQHAARQWKLAMIAHNDLLAAAFCSLCIKARAEFVKARQAREAWEVAERRVIPVAEFAALRSNFIVPLANLLRNMPAELAPLVNPNNTAHALNQGTSYLTTRLQPQIQRLIDGLNDYAPAPAHAEPAAA